MSPKTVGSLIGLEELSNNRNGLGKALVAEALGTFFINYIGCLSSLSPPFQSPNLTTFGSSDNTSNLADHTFSSDPILAQTIITALCSGLVIFALIQTLVHVSGSQLNPAVTISLLATGKLTVVRATLYILVQCLGGIAGSGTLRLLVSEGTGAAKPSLQRITPVQALGLEFFLGFMLVLVVFGVCDPNKPFIKLNAGLAIGWTVAVGHLTTIQFTGSGMNPARSLGAAVITGTWDCHWVYWVGPCVGGVAAGFLYDRILAAPQGPAYTPVNVEEKELKCLECKNKDKFAYSEGKKV